MTEEHIIELETRIAFLERNQQDLSDVIAEQQKEIISLARNNQVLYEKLQALLSGEEINPEFEKPPHY